MGIFGDEMWEVKEQKKSKQFSSTLPVEPRFPFVSSAAVCTGLMGMFNGSKTIITPQLWAGCGTNRPPKHELTINRSFDTPIRFTFLILTPKALQFHAVFFLNANF